MKSLIGYGLYFCYIGQTLAAIAQPVILNSPGKISSTWFRDERVEILNNFKLESYSYLNMLFSKYYWNNIRIRISYFILE
jgi:hypothetical protein